MINNNKELITCQKKNNTKFSSNDQYFIYIEGMDIKNDRSQDDYACLDNSIWSGIE